MSLVVDVVRLMQANQPHSAMLAVSFVTECVRDNERGRQ